MSRTINVRYFHNPVVIYQHPVRATRIIGGLCLRNDKKVLICGADFETDWNEDETEAWVCQWSLCIVRDRSNEKRTKDKTKTKASSVVKHYHGYTLDSFMATLRELARNKSTKYVIYFHNLKYDFQFMRSAIWDWVREHELIDRPEPDTDTAMLLELLGIPNQPLGSYVSDYKDCALISNSNSPILIQVDNIEIRDSLKKVAGGTVKDMGKSIGLPKLESPRGAFYSGWSRDLTDDDFQYVDRDAEIVARRMKLMHASGFVKPTMSGDAYSHMITAFNKAHVDKRGRG